MMSVKPVLIMAGGTGGHVFPALAVADELRSRGVPIVWLGTRNGIEARVVKQAGYQIEWLSITGLRGKNTATLLLAPFRLITACAQAFRVLWQRKPSAVLGMGGFTAGPGGLMAWLMRRPLLIHEQNAVAGLTNRILARFANEVLEAFPQTFRQKASTVGNPVRKQIQQLSDPQMRIGSHTGPLRILVIGGSLGAVRLNEIVPEAMSKMVAEARPEILHQTGLSNLEMTRQMYQRHDVDARIEAFIDDMAEAYGCHAVDDHQTANAEYLAKAGAAIVRQQHELGSEWLCETITQMTQQRDTLVKMAMAARSMAKPDAANEVADRCMQTGGLA
jgi:UDP-N-acetylglucosamine--N-acetylmuramyl-(pentapeptide) pyrophosphoryl-undecaprenol N-acetylglucosamine transferase